MKLKNIFMLIFLTCIIISINIVNCTDDIKKEIQEATTTTVSSTDSTVDAISYELEPDQINDIDESEDNFSFNMIKPLEIKLTVFNKDFSKYTIEEPSFKKSEDTISKVVITIENEENGKVIYQGVTDFYGKLDTVIAIDRRTKNCVMKLWQKHCKSREIVIENLGLKKTIDRTMYMAYDINNITALTDTDEDYIPDELDTYPENSEIAFTLNYPPDEEAYAITFEDLYPNLGDYDFNDFIAHYKIEHYINGDGNIVSMKINTKAIARGAGYNHDYYLKIKQDTSSSGVYDINYLDENSEILTSSLSNEFQADINLPIFTPTKNAFEAGASTTQTNTKMALQYYKGRTTEVEIRFETPVSPNNLSLPPYDPYLYVKNTGYDVHLIGESPMDGTKNPLDEQDFIDENGYPWALLIPISWLHPIEFMDIRDAYPDYQSWVDSGGLEHNDWVDNYIEDKVYSKHVFYGNYQAEVRDTKILMKIENDIIYIRDKNYPNIEVLADYTMNDYNSIKITPKKARCIDLENHDNYIDIDVNMLGENIDQLILDFTIEEQSNTKLIVNNSAISNDLITFNKLPTYNFQPSLELTSLTFNIELSSNNYNNKILIMHANSYTYSNLIKNYKPKISFATIIDKKAVIKTYYSNDPTFSILNQFKVQPVFNIYGNISDIKMDPNFTLIEGPLTSSIDIIKDSFNVSVNSENTYNVSF